MATVARPITAENARAFIAGKSAHALLSFNATASPPVGADDARARGAADAERTAEKVARRAA
jgi:hypothetical protein